MTQHAPCGQSKCRYCSQWRPEVVERFEALWDRGYGAEAIRLILHQEHGVLFSTSAISGKVFRLGLLNRRRSFSKRKKMAS